MDLSRTEALIGKSAVEILCSARVAVFGLGGVGSYAVEALARAGVGKLVLVDDDTVAPSNVNRQLYALSSTIGREKALVAKERVLDINPQAEVDAKVIRFDENTAPQFDFSDYDYVIDAIDTVTSKLLLAARCTECNTPIISCMGTGNKLNPTAFTVADIFETSVCPLAKVMRKELNRRGITKLKTVYSQETPFKPDVTEAEKGARRQTPSSISFTPSVAGLIAAGEVIKDLIKE